MGDGEKALELTNGSLANDNASSKSHDSKDIEAGDLTPNLQPITRDKDLEAHTGQTHDEKVSRQSRDLGHHEAPYPDPYLVEWDGDNDPENPLNFPFAKKVWLSTMASFLTFAVGFSSSIFSADITVTAEKFNVSREVMVLGVSLYVLGFACGMFERLQMRAECSGSPLNQVRYSSVHCLNYMDDHDRCLSAS